MKRLLFKNDPLVFSDRAFWKSAFALAIPSILQGLIASSLTIIDTVMIGTLGETEIAAVGLCSRFTFLVGMFFFGVSSTLAVFAAQYFGKQDRGGISAAHAMALIISLLGGGLFCLSTQIAPEGIMRLLSPDPAVIQLGARYLRIAGWLYVIQPITLMSAAVMRSVSRPTPPMLTSLAGMLVNAVLNYGLIFGALGLPRMGVAGAALATVIAAGVDCLLLQAMCYLGRTPAALSPRHVRFDIGFIPRFLKLGVTIVSNEMLWGLASTVFSALYAHTTTGNAAAMNIFSTMEQLMWVAVNGAGAACSVLVGQRLGALDFDNAYRYARRLIVLTPMLGIVIASIVAACGGLIVRMYNITPEVATTVRWLLVAYIPALGFKTFNYLIGCGALRTGGDARYMMVLDLCSIWLIGVTGVYLGTQVLHWALPLVYLLQTLDEMFKPAFYAHRFRSRKWIKTLVHGGEGAGQVAS
nr:MATE family efflux transporter [bacterium]